MPTARSQQIDLSTTPYYHCMVRCVRKAFLCGTDEHGKDYNYRRDWIESRLKLLSEAFAIDIVSYAVMQNHYHVILHVNPTEAASWNAEEVKTRWKTVVKLNSATVYPLEEIQRWRENLQSISWFMRFMNEFIARRANKEDDVTGRFWEGRFKSQALTDEGALLACSAYVDLNPIRAKVAKTLETSEYTSIQERLEAFRHEKPTPLSLMPFQSEPHESSKAVLPFSLKDYLSLVDWTGRQIREDKGSIDVDVPPILQQNGLNPNIWIHTVNHYGSEYQGIAGTLKNLKCWAAKIGQQFIRNQNLSKQRYLSSE